MQRKIRDWGKTFNQEWRKKTKETKKIVLAPVMTDVNFEAGILTGMEDGRWPNMKVKQPNAFCHNYSDCHWIWMFEIEQSSFLCYHYSQTH